VAEKIPIARSPIAPPPPVSIIDGWEVSGRRSSAALRITDCTPLAKVTVRAGPAGDIARLLGVSFGRAARDAHRALVVGSGPGEWMLLGAPGTAAAIAARIAPSQDRELVTVIDATHGRALIRVTGADSAKMLSKLCAVDLSDEVTPDGAAFRSSVAALVTDVIRDDIRPDEGSADGPTADIKVRSYLLHCERSSGQYLFDSLLDAGAEFSIEVDGFTTPGL
jgi:heterotetrameric sarcosine oxidase gamma subunit